MELLGAISMHQIAVGKTAFALVDADVVELIRRRSWRLDRNGYPVATTKGKNLYMHILVLGGAPDGCVIDHKNCNPLDNRRENLRFATYLQNSANAKIRKDNKSGFKGVHWNKQAKRWNAQIRIDGKPKSLGYFQNAETAARAYDAKAKELFGEFAWLNFPE